MNGDPHLHTFDRLNAGKRDIIFRNPKGTDTYWIVKSSRIEMIGKYGCNAWMRSLTVRGAFLQGHELIFTEDGKVTWDGDPINFRAGPEVTVALQSGLVEITMQSDPLEAWERNGGGNRHLAPHVNTPKGFLVTLPLNVFMRVHHRGHGCGPLLDLRLMMHPESDQSGQCGNFNGDPHDDTMDMMNGQAVGGRLLSTAGASIPAERASEEDICSATSRAEATSLCRAVCGKSQEGAVAAAFLEDCIYDVCMVGPEMAVWDCAMGWHTQNALDSEKARPVGAGCCKPQKFASGEHHLSNRTREECAHECASNGACTAFAISGCSSASDEVCGGACHLYAVDRSVEVVSGECFEPSNNGNTVCYAM